MVRRGREDEGKETVKTPQIEYRGINKITCTSGDCQEIGLVAFMFFFELLFSYVSPQFPSMFPLLTYSQSFSSLSADHPRHSRQRRSKNLILLIQEKV